MGRRVSAAAGAGEQKEIVALAANCCPGDAIAHPRAGGIAHRAAVPPRPQTFTRYARASRSGGASRRAVRQFPQHDRRRRERNASRPRSRAAGALLRSDRPGDTLDLIALIPKSPGVLEPVTLEGNIDDNHAEHAMASIPTRDGEIALEPALAAAMKCLAATP